jgi:hypothetical protein
MTHRRQNKNDQDHWPKPSTERNGCRGRVGNHRLSTEQISRSIAEAPQSTHLGDEVIRHINQKGRRLVRNLQTNTGRRGVRLGSLRTLRRTRGGIARRSLEGSDDNLLLLLLILVGGGSRGSRSGLVEGFLLSLLLSGFLTATGCSLRLPLLGGRAGGHRGEIER